MVIAVLKAYAAKFNVRKISVNSSEGALELPSINSLKDERIHAALSSFGSRVKLSMAKAPVILFIAERTATKTMLSMTKFLKFAATFA
jgi:hypothetical protein